MNRTLKVMILALAAAGCQATAGEGDDRIALPASPASKAPEARAVNLLTVGPAPVDRPIDATGNTAAIRSADLGAPMTARIEGLEVKIGDRVEAGRLLVRLDDTQARLRASQAQAQATAAGVQADQVQADHARLAPLAQRGSLPRGQIEQLAAQARSAKASATAARAAARAAGQAVSESEVRAPFAGVILDLPKEVGEVVTLAPATTVARLADLSRLEVAIRVHARDLRRVTVGDPATVTLANLGVTVDGQVVRIGHEIDPVTRTAEVVAVIDNAQGAPIGAFASVTLRPASREALVVPDSAVDTRGERPAVFVIADGRAQRRPVEVKRLDQGRFEVLGGLKAGERIIRDRLQAVSEGMAVAPASTPAKGG